ncbi:MAG TPA: S8 family serine peptidase [Thermomonospora sp.]|nr:S8 family serine peptidase [Thermomonospora sp.]
MTFTTGPVAAEPSPRAAYDHSREKGKAPGTHGPLPQGFSTTELTVKFKPDREVRIKDRRASAGDSGDASALNAVLARYPDARVAPLTDRPAAEVVAERQRLERRTGRRLPDLTSWYTITVSRGIENLLRDLNRLPSVEIAQAAPEFVPAAEPLQSRQRYRDPVGSPTGSGLNVDAVNAVPGGRGDGVMITDLEAGDEPSVVPAAAPGSVAAGDDHSLLVDAPYTAGMPWKTSVWASGGNGQGQLGDGTTTDRDELVKVRGLSEVRAVAAGGGFSLALKTDGTVWAWGDNDQGQLGNGTATDSATPVQVSGIANAVGISAGGDGHALAVLADGTVKAWGDNDQGQLGNGTTTDSASPLTVLTGASAQPGTVAAGGGHSLVVLADGTVRAWGDNANGQLGNGGTADSLTPVQVGGLSGVEQVSAGRQHTLALLSDGTARAWGDNSRGQLGNGTTTDSGTPVQAAGLTSVSGVAAGGFHSLATVSGLHRWAWGANDEGRLGDGTTTDRHTPVDIAVSAGGSVMVGGLRHTVAASATMLPLEVWGANDKGQLGTGNTTAATRPVAPITRLAKANFCHEDLAGRAGPGGPLGTLVPTLGQCRHENVEHPTAVAGIIGAPHDNGKGIAGVAPHARLRVDQWSDSMLLQAVEESAPGDVILYEVHVAPAEPGRYYPAEVDPLVYDLTVLATAAGVIVVEPAGNGHRNLDDPDDPYAVTVTGRPDSGAIMVGAGAPATDAASGCTYTFLPPERTAMGFSNYGARVDVQAYGACIWTTTSVKSSVSHPPTETDPNKIYTRNFAGTSGASAIVAGAVAALQGAAKKLGGPLSPQYMRHVLKTTGTPEPVSATRRIGPQPNLRAALDLLLGEAPPR